MFCNHFIFKEYYHNPFLYYHIVDGLIRTYFSRKGLVRRMFPAEVPASHLIPQKKGKQSLVAVGLPDQLKRIQV